MNLGMALLRERIEAIKPYRNCFSKNERAIT